jgi:DNA polymerase-1
MTERPLLYLIDGHALAYRQYFALERTQMATRAGEKTFAVQGFASVLLSLLEKNPHYLAVSFDKGLSGRDAVYPPYKAQRDAMPEGLVTQFTRIFQLVDAFNIPVLALEGYEADDVIGTVVQQAEAQGIDVHIITGDRDILQLLTPHVRVQLPDPRAGEDAIYDIPAFVDKYKLQPHQLVDMKGLMGDSSDNIPGVKGVGEKTATTLLQTYGTLENIYDHLHEQKGALLAKLTEGRELAFLSRDLARIMRDLPLTLDLQACVATDFDRAKVDALFGELEFRSLRSRLAKLNIPTAKGGAPAPAPVEAPAPSAQTVIVTTQAQLEALTARLQSARVIVFDAETTGTEPMRAELVGLALAVDDEVGYYIPVGHVAEGEGTLFAMPIAEQLPLVRVVDALLPAMTNPNIAKVAHNATFDLMMLQNVGIDVRPITFDTMIAEWVRDPLSRFLGLKAFARQELGVAMRDIEELIGTGKKQVTMAQVGIQEAGEYASRDAVVTYKAYRFLSEKLQEAGLQRLFEEIEMPLIPIIAAMERAGAKLDLPFLAQMSAEFDAQLRRIETHVYELAGGAFNLNSPKQLNDVLFGRLNLPVKGLKKTTHGYSTDVTTLEALYDAHPVIAVMMEYRELSKLKSTYIDALPTLINPRTGRVHTSYNQTGTSTGRFSSSNPNLQNIPIRTALGREIRKAFIAEDGYVLLAVDYSQIELRVMAHISRDHTLQQAFHQGQDIHKATAAAVYGIPLEEVTYEQRSFAKRVNFGLMYGMGAFRLARDSELTLAQADDFIKTYFERLPAVRDYIEATKRQAREQGYVETLLGRRRYFRRLQKGELSAQDAQAELRAAINAPIQGTAADILKIAMRDLYYLLQEHYPQVRMILQVHDELVLEVPSAQLQEVARLVVTTMEGAYKLDVPLVANAEYGANWLEMNAVE